MHSSKTLDETLSPLYDLHMIYKMCQGNENQVLKLIEIFIRQVSKGIKEIKTAYSQNDLPRIKRAIHYTKPSLTYYGTFELEKRLFQIETLVDKKKATNNLYFKISRLETLTNEVIDKMKWDFSLTNK